MMRVPVEVKRSDIHGYGIFALREIAKHEIVWSFSRLFDHVIPQHVLVRAPMAEQQILLFRSFRNPHDEDTVVMCGDEAQFMNFPPLGVEPNVYVSGCIDGFDVLAAGKVIEVGEELTAPPISDLDYHVKLLGYAPVIGKES